LGEKQLASNSLGKYPPSTLSFSGYDDEAFLSIVMSESAEVSHNTAKRASPEGYQMQQPFSNGSSAQRGIRPHPQQHFGGIPPDKRPRYDV